MQTYIITGRGKLYVSGETFAFYDVESEKTRKIPAKQTDAILLFAQASITGDAIHLASKNKTIIVYAPRHRVSAVILPTSIKSTGKVHIAQARAFIQEREKIARAIEKYGVSVADEKNTRLKIDDAFRSHILAKMDDAKTIEEIMGIEGIFYHHYYRLLDGQLPQKLQIGGRAYHPPITRGNAVVSFINAMIYANILPALCATGLDPSISYIHEPVHGPISLSLDVAEMYRPVLLSRTFLAAVHKYKLAPEDFQKQRIAWYLNRSGRQKVARAFMEQINRVVMVEGRRRRLLSVIVKNAVELKKAVVEDRTPKFHEYRVT